MTNDPYQPIPTGANEVWYTRCAVPTSFGITVQRGAFDDEFSSDSDLRWLSIQHSDDPDIRQSHFSHTKLRSLRHGGNAPAIWARSRGANTRLVGLSWVPIPHLVLARPESGIAGPEDLRGKRLLLLESPASAIDVWQLTTLRTYGAALSSAGLTFDDVTLVRAELPRLDPRRFDTSKPGPGSFEELAARSVTQQSSLIPLVRGEVDAIAGEGHSAVELAALLGATVVYDQSADPDRARRVNNDLPDTLTVGSELLEEDPALVTRVISRLLETEAWTSTHHDQVIELLSREIGASEDVLRVIYDGELGRSFDLNLDEERIAAIRSQKDFLLQNGFLKEDFDLHQWIDTAPLERARQLLHQRQHGTPSHGEQALASAGAGRTQGT